MKHYLHEGTFPSEVQKVSKVLDTLKSGENKFFKIIGKYIYY